MAQDIDQIDFIKNLDLAVSKIPEATALGVKLASKGFSKIFLIACGAGYQNLDAIKYWLDRLFLDVETHIFYPAEFLYQMPKRLDSNSIVLLVSHSGTTPEVLKVAEFLKESDSNVVGITKSPDSPLALNSKYFISYGETNRSYFSIFIVTMAFIAGYLKEKNNWPLYNNIIQGLENLPQLLLGVQEKFEYKAAEIARLYKDDDYFMVLGSGPMYSIAYILGVCIFMEMQWMHPYIGEAAEFFHGPFEVLDKNTPVIIFLGEDPSRPIGQRIIKFCQKITERLIIFDTKEFNLPGFDNDLRSFFGPLILYAAADRVAQHLAVWHGHPLSTRRYMWKFDY